MATLSNPLALIAEITHRCPLHCVYCSNPLELAAANSELKTDDWRRVFAEAAQMGVLHLHLTGGEPLARTDLEDLISSAHKANLYTNLITSGLGLSRERLKKLVDAGLDHIQLSFQDGEQTRADWIAGTKSHAYKIDLAAWIREHKVAFTANLVVHRQNLDYLEDTLTFLETLRPGRIEIAHTQYYGWALKNRAALMPTPTQLEKALQITSAFAQRVKGMIRIDSVVPDYYAQYPKACMGGWGRRILLIDPAGRAMPCHAAGVIPGLEFENIRDRSLRDIWAGSSAFNKFRGEDWMQEPCRSCERRAEDFGGCRCQALLLAGDAAATDPVCSLAPAHHLVQQIQSQSPDNVVTTGSLVESWNYRPNPSRV
ncbi:MAG TPA: pyrroloquinoline quinone biosynthesis protein PqqE [Terriglobales bacterium]|nr:pyrroloquinoline quinone biosynthesis protein PqqE [Terriglobales bacterium]